MFLLNSRIPLIFISSNLIGTQDDSCQSLELLFLANVQSYVADFPYLRYSI